MKKYLLAIICIPLVIYSLGCGDVKEIRVEEFEIDWDSETSQITISCIIMNSYDEPKTVTIHGWFEAHGDNPNYYHGGPRTYQVPQPEMGLYGETRVEFVFTDVPQFDDACWGFDWSEGIVNDVSHDLYDKHYERENYKG